MATYKLVVGFTDVWDEQTFKSTIPKEEMEDNINYNLYKQNPEIEKKTIEWKFLTDRPAVSKFLKLWENIIRIPHLQMVRNHIVEHSLNPDYKTFNFSIHYKELIPFDDIVDVFFEMDDYQYFQNNTKFGDIYWNDQFLLKKNHKNTLHWAIKNKNIEFLEPNSDFQIPGFLCNFNFTEFFSSYNDYNVFINQEHFFEENYDKLDELGYNLDHPKTKIGNYIIAEMITSPFEAFDTLMQYSYVCRISIVEE